MTASRPAPPCARPRWRCAFRKPERIVVAVPVAAPETCAAFRKFVDDVICVRTPEQFHAVGLWYDDFTQTTDEEVRALLHEQGSRQGAA